MGVRKVTFPVFEAQECEVCSGTGKNPGTLPASQCTLCVGKGTLPPPKPLNILGQCLNPTQKETQEGKGVGMVEMALNYPIVQALKQSEDLSEMFLSQEQWTHLCERINVTQWRGHNDEIFLICQAVLQAADVEAKEAEQANHNRKVSKEEKGAQRAAQAAGRGNLKVVESPNGEKEPATEPIFAD